MHKKILISFYFVVLMALTVKGQLTISPSEYTFPSTQTGLQVIQNFEIQNSGSSATTLEPENIFLTGQNQTTTEISVLTYNIENDDGNWPGRFAYILSELRQLDVDIIGLQEVLQNAVLDNQAMQLADSLGFHYYFDSVDEEGSTTRFGNAIVSRYPIVETNYHRLIPENTYRLAIHARINVNGNLIDVFNTHLHNPYHDNEVRIIQVNDLMNFIEQTRSSDIVFLTGDLNANPDWEETELLYDEFQETYQLFHENHLDPEHASMNAELGHQMRRIDYVFFRRQGMLDQLLTPLSASIVLNKDHEDPQLESDHYGVFTSYRIQGEDAHYSLNKPTSSINLQSGESENIQLVFNPFSVGSKDVFLEVEDNTLPVFGTAFDATITNFPWITGFSESPPSGIPFGWASNTNDWYVSATNNAGSTSPELHFESQSLLSQTAFVRTPPLQTAGIDSISIAFETSAGFTTSDENITLQFITISGTETHVAWEMSISESMAPQQVNLQLNAETHGVGNDLFFVGWRIPAPATDGFWSIDDIEVQTLPALATSFVEVEFDDQQTGSTSEPVTIILENIGGGVLEISPQDITLVGEDSSQFILNKPTELISLQNNETQNLSVAFSPHTPGNAEAGLMIAERTIPLSGEAFDPTIYALPWSEGFSNQLGGGIPQGWQSNADNWDAFMMNSAGGFPPEMVFWWEPVNSGEYFLQTPAFEINNADTLVLIFKSRINDFQNPGIYDLWVSSISNNQEYRIEEWNDPASTDAFEFAAILDDENHGTGNQPFYLRWSFDGASNNINSWIIDDIQLYDPGDEPIVHISPEQFDFGSQTVNSASDLQDFEIQNRGGGTLNLTAGEVIISGEHADDFNVHGFSELNLGLLETGTVGVSFQPTGQGFRNAVLTAGEDTIQLSGFGNVADDIFVYSDFSISEGGLDYTNVDGFRELGGGASGLTATDVDGQGQYGGVVLQLEYDLGQVEDFTSYWMWAFPSVDLSEYTHILLRLRAEKPAGNVRVQILDSDAISGGGNLVYTYVNVSETYQWVQLPVSEFETGGGNLPDMSSLQRIDIVFENGNTTPAQNTLFVDVVGFNKGQTVNAPIYMIPGVKMYPNPAYSKVLFHTVDQARIKIINTSGMVVKTIESISGRTQTDISDLSRGVYLVQIEQGGTVATKKLIIMK